MPQKKLLIILASLLLITGLIFAAWWFFLKEKSTGSAELADLLPSITTEPSKPVSIPQDILANPFGFPSIVPQDTDILADFRVRWVRPHPGPFQWDLMQSSPTSPIDFATTDQLVLGYGQAKFGTLVTLWPFADFDQANLLNPQSCLVSSKDIFAKPQPGQKVLGDKDFKDDPNIDYQKDGQDTPSSIIDLKNKLGKESGSRPDPIFLPQSRCNPSDWDSYLTWVKALVERYDGDGVNDLPGLTIPIKYYEILNEPDLNAQHLDFYQGSPADYAELLIKTSKAIKQADPDAKVLIAGAAGGSDHFLNFYRSVFKDPLTHSAFDIANVHCISGEHYQSFNVEPYQQMLTEFNLTKPIWVTEAEALVSYDSDINASQTYASTKKALKLGTQRIFFSNIMFDRDPSKPSLPESNLKLTDYPIKLDGSDPIASFQTITQLTRTVLVTN